MARSSWSRRSYLLPLVLLASQIADADPHFHDHDEGLHSFVSRPDLKAPKWKVNITEPDLVSPGYWFVAPFENIDQREPGNGWIGPHIYDGNGELVWSGVHISKNWNVLDFKMSNVRGKDLMTMLLNREGNGLILDNSYQEVEKMDAGQLGRDFNSHEFNFIENGERAIILDEGHRDATKEMIDALKYDKNCKGLFEGFKELDTRTWETIFEWNSWDHIGLNESSFLDGGAGARCSDPFGWDFVHLNSVDKDQNGDYYVSGRHTDTIYKVSKDDGHIIWRLHGRQEEFGEWDMKDLSFSRQHNVRFRGFNGTHEFITILDNAHGQDEQRPTHHSSRGLVIALDPAEKRARIVSEIPHPHGDGNFAPRRGNYQVMPDGHIFMGWSEQATHSEHDADGKLLMSATLLTEWLGTYRSYKFPFVGHPTEPLAVHSAAHASRARNSTTTLVHVSWNGATEVASYNLYKTTDTGSPIIPIFHKQKTGFETALAWDGYASYVIVEALDKSGNLIARTPVFETIPPPADAMSEAVAEELYWLQHIHGENDNQVPALSTYSYSFTSSSRTWNVGISALIATVLLICSVWGWKQLRHRGYLNLRTWRYSSVSGSSSSEGEDEMAEDWCGRASPPLAAHRRVRSDLHLRDGSR